jgi:hypothetical protein
MIAAESRGGKKTSLNEALGWIGSRVDDIYGANVGRLDDVWIDPGTGVPRWLLVKEGRFGGRSTLIPFEDATAGAGHVWVPYEREVVRQAPEVEAGASLTQQVEAALRSHYSANSPAAVSHRSQAAPPPAAQAPADQGFDGSNHETSYEQAPVAQGHASHDHAYGEPRPAPTVRPVPHASPAARAEPGRSIPEAPPQPVQPAHGEPHPAYQPPPERSYREPALETQPGPAEQHPRAEGQPPAALRGVVSSQLPPRPVGPAREQPPASAPDPQNVVGIRSASLGDLERLTEPGAETYVELEITGEIRIRGSLRNVRIIPQEGPGD